MREKKSFADKNQMVLYTDINTFIELLCIFSHYNYTIVFAVIMYKKNFYI